MKLLETSIPANYSEIVKAMGFRIEPIYVDRLFNAGFTSVAHFLQLTKTKGKVALKLTDENNTFLFAAIVLYVPAENKMPASYTFEITFDEDDIENAQVYEMEDNEFKKILNNVSFSSAGMRFKNDNGLLYTYKFLFKSLVDWLKTNDGKIEHDTFTAISEVEGEERLMSIVPDGVTKQLVKGDATEETV